MSAARAACSRLPHVTMAHVLVGEPVSASPEHALLRPRHDLSTGTRPLSSANMRRDQGGTGSGVGGAFQGGLVFEAIIAGEAADQLGVHPVLQDAAEVLPGDPGHRGEVALAHLLPDQDAARADVLAERLTEAQEG